MRLWWRKSRTSDEKLARRETPAKTRKKKTREERGKTTQENSVQQTDKKERGMRGEKRWW